MKEGEREAYGSRREHEKKRNKTEIGKSKESERRHGDFKIEEILTKYTFN